MPGALAWLAAIRDLPNLSERVASLSAEVTKLRTEIVAPSSAKKTHALKKNSVQLDTASSISTVQDHTVNAAETSVLPRSRAKTATPSRSPCLADSENMEALEKFLEQHEEDLLGQWKTFRGSLGSIDDQRRENATWRLWAKARKDTMEEVAATAPLVPKFRRRFLIIGMLLGGVMALLLVPFVAPPVLLDEATQRLQYLLDATLNKTQRSAAEPDKTIPALQLTSELSPKHPLLLLPGLVTTGLEVWKAGECLGGPNAYFRQRLWGSSSMVQAAVLNATCWLEHLKLDAETGLDPPGIKLRPASGFEAADYLMANYWVWAKLIENLGMLGYDGNTMTLLPYDWRLSFEHMEERDQIFSRMKSAIELMVDVAKEKAVIIAHSMGANVWLYFMQWVTMSGRGNRGGEVDWVDRHIHSFVNLGGPLLGAMGPMTALLSGEAHLGALGTFLDPLVRRFLGDAGRKKIAEVMRTWGGLSELLPSGGDAVWGSEAEVTDCRCNVLTREGSEPLGIDEALALVTEVIQKVPGNCNTTGQCKLPPPMPDRLHSGARAVSPLSWKPLDVALPHAPDMKIFCMYGVGIRTERAYRYTAPSPEEPEGRIDYTHHVRGNSYTGSAFEYSGMDYGLATVDGDGTVPLVSLGYMCQEGWRKFSSLNPSASKTFIREYIDEPTSVISDVRGGQKTAKHVEMLGNSEIIVDVLHIAAGKDQAFMEDRVHSRIAEISRRITDRLGPQMSEDDSDPMRLRPRSVKTQKRVQ